MICAAGFRIILGVIIINKVYEIEAKGVKFYLFGRFADIFWRVGSFGSFLLESSLNDFALDTGSLSRFVLRFLFPEGAVGLRDCIKDYCKQC